MTELLQKSHLEGRIFDGGWNATQRSYDVIEPATGSVLAKSGLADAVVVAKASAAAALAQPEWAAMPADARAGVLRAAAAHAREHSEEILTWLMRESGSVRPKAEFELAVAIKAIELASAMPHEAQGIVLPSEPGRLSIAKRRPRGVVGVIAPFNFPLYLAIRAVAPALAVGNAVILKPDPRTAICGGFVLARIFELAGLPKGVFAVLPGGGDAGEALCTDPKVAMIQFTGSTNAGRKVGETASRHLKRVSLELGGKNTLIVLDDADLDLAVKNAAWGAYLHQGQICMTSGRILVQDSLIERFSKALAQKAAGLPVGDPMSGTVALGPLINRPQLDHALDIVRRSVDEGAQLLAGGTAEGLCMAPTVLGGVKPGMAAYDEEIFGPVAVLVPFSTDEEAIELANDTEYGLSAGIIARDVGRAMLIAERLRTGLVHVNDQTVNDEVTNPFGGVGASGNGTAIGGPANWEEFAQWQWMTVKGTPTAYPF